MLFHNCSKTVFFIYFNLCLKFLFGWKTCFKRRRILICINWHFRRTFHMAWIDIIRFLYLTFLCENWLSSVHIFSHFFWSEQSLKYILIKSLHFNMFVIICNYSTPLHMQVATQGSIFKWNLMFEFSVYLQVDRLPYPKYYLRIARGGIARCIPFQSTIWNANSLIQNMNLGFRVHFLRW